MTRDYDREALNAFFATLKEEDFEVVVVRSQDLSLIHISYGIDECWLDVTGSSSLKGDGLLIAQEISRRMKSELGITVSVGVSFNKIFAKLGSDYKKPDAITTCLLYTSIDRVFLHKGFFFLITNEKKLLVLKTVGVETEELIKIIKGHCRLFGCACG